MRLRRSLGTLSLVAILYFTVSGGPFTTEGLVHAVGPGVGLLLILLVPIVWSVPEALIVGELASMLPEEGGYYRWVERAFGPFWAFQNGWLTWMYSLVDMALYPLLFLAYLGYFVPGLTPLEKWALALAMIWGATAINLFGALRVGRSSVVSGVFIVVGFLAVTLAALPHAHHTPWVPFTKPGQGAARGIAVGLSLALWNYIGWDNASTVQGEVRDATRSYPRALAIALPLVTVGYLLPLLATLAATDWRTWTDGGWPEIARAATGGFGPFLAGWIALAGIVSALGLFNALLLAYSRIPFVMADDGFLPARLAKTDRTGTPANAVLVSAVCYSVFVLVPFGRLIVADVVLYSLALFLEFGSLIALRKREPQLRGAFRIPVGRGGVIALAAIPMAIMAYLVYQGVVGGDYEWPALAGSAVAVALGPLWFRIAARTPRGRRRLEGVR
ncbi:MAG: APC family permease [Gemmatimonadota bacterium]|nr:APC family permease [Gemmatimonadota bacterium]